MVSEQKKPAEAEAEASEPILDLSTIAPRRPWINVRTPEAPDGEPYEFRLLEHDFSAQEHADFTRDLGEFDDLWGRGKRTSAQGKRMTALLKRLLGLVLAEPGALPELLTDEQKRSVVLTFQYAPALTLALAQQKDQEAAESAPTTGS